MKKNKLLLFPLSLALIAGLIWVMSSMAQRKVYVRPGSAAKAGEHKWAVIIGVNHYEHTQILDLEYAVADAQGVYEVVVHKDYGGFETKKVRLLTDNSKTKPTRKNILKALKSIEKVADEDDTIFIFFAGHGIEEEGVSYFLPNDADVSILADTGIPMERFTQALNRTKAKVQVMFFDACHSGVRRDRAVSGRLSRRTFSRIFTEVKGRAILSSCEADEVSWKYPEKGHGVFTYYLLEALRGKADDGDGFVTVSETSNYVTEKVKEWAFNTRKTQNPRLMYNVSGEIVLTLSQEQPKPDQVIIPGERLDAQPPQIIISKPSVSNGGQVTLELPESEEIQIEGHITDDVAIQSATVNDSSLTLGRGGRFTVSLPVAEGLRYPLRFRAMDTFSKETTYDFTIVIPRTRVELSEMVLIPAGEFQMGTDSDKIPGLVRWAKKWYSSVEASWFERETPRHTVYLDAFYMDKYEVTVGQYKKFINATGHSAPDWSNVSKYSPTDNHPIVYVSWNDAQKYAKWAGKRLPTEAEWEKAARGGLVGKKFPWGDKDPDGTQCNFADKNTDYSRSDKSVDDGYQYTAPVGSFTPNGYGLYDMAGNVWEWCADWYAEDYYANSPSRNPQGPSSGEYRVCRGGSWLDAPGGVRAAFRGWGDPTFSSGDVGFRCVVSPSFLDQK